MKDFPGTVFSLLLVLWCMFFCSCLSQNKEAIELSIANSQQQFQAGDFEKAINSYYEAYQKYPDEPTVLASYLKTLEEIRQSADSAFDKKEFTRAEEVYLVLLNNYPKYGKSEKSLSFTKEYLKLKIKNCQISATERLVRQHYEATDYGRALDSYRILYQRYPNDPILLANFVQMAEEIKNLADGTFSKKNFIPAGKMYQALLKNYQYFKRSQKPLSFPEESLKNGIKNSSSQLTKKGLEQYRKGNIAEAISTWEGILLFDPENLEIKKAIETAKIQLKKLKQKK